MKTIKEMAEDLYPDKKVVLARGNTCLSCGKVKRESFEAGANYVLDHLSKTISVSEDGFLRDNLMRDNLRKMIKLLEGE